MLHSQLNAIPKPAALWQGSRCRWSASPAIASARSPSAHRQHSTYRAVSTGTLHPESSSGDAAKEGGPPFMHLELSSGTKNVVQKVKFNNTKSVVKSRAGFSLKRAELIALGHPCCRGKRFNCGRACYPIVPLDQGRLMPTAMGAYPRPKFRPLRVYRGGFRQQLLN